jgi:hypothetical protein
LDALRKPRLQAPQIIDHNQATIELDALALSTVLANRSALSNQ